MEHAADGRVRQAVDAWLRWLPSWRPSSTRSRRAICRKCYGSPLADAAGFGPEVPHAVQHALVMRLTAIVDDAVDDYTARNLPLLHSELQRSAARKARRPYRPEEGLAPEYQGLDPDPEAAPGEPFLFTLAELAAEADAEAGPMEPPPEFSAEAKQILRREIQLSDERANEVGRSICLALGEHRLRIERGLRECVEPQVQELLDQLTEQLDAPGGF